MAYKTIGHDEGEFHFVDGFSLVPRAMIEMSKDCPQSYKDMVHMCYNKGWLKVVAHVPDVEYTWEQLKS